MKKNLSSNKHFNLSVKEILTILVYRTTLTISRDVYFPWITFLLIPNIQQISYVFPNKNLSIPF